MKITDKLKYIQDNHFSEWLKTRQIVANEESDKQPIFCVCGKLATGPHERNCRKLSKRITNLTLKRLEHLIIPPQKLSKNNWKRVIDLYD